MKRLLCIVGGMNAGGAETFLMKLYRNFDKEKYQMDFCVSKLEKGFYDDEILSMGGKILHTTAKSKNPFASFKSIYDIVKRYDYKYVMRVSQHSLSALELLAAKLAGAEVRVFRSSNSNTMKAGLSRTLHIMFKFLPKIVANVKIAPSTPAAEFMFGKKSVEKGEVIFLKNGIPLEQFTFNDRLRYKVRNEIGIKNELLLGHIGRFSDQKNHTELIDIFVEVVKSVQDAHLMLIGEGELEVEIKNKVNNLKLSDQVHFMGVRKDIPALLSAMDVFVFPSLYEGMPNTVIEAQANGVPCMIADTITSEVKMCKNLSMLPLGMNSIWKDKIINEAVRIDSKINQKQLCKQGYDINKVCNDFQYTVFERK